MLMWRGSGRTSARPISGRTQVLNIIGPEDLIFGVDDLDSCIKYVEDYGLKRREGSASGGVYEAVDGTSMTILKSSDASLAAPIAASPNIREQIYGVADK